MKSRYAGLLLVLIVILIAALVGCTPAAQQPAAEGAASGQADGKTTAPIKIGVPAPITGPYAHDGLIAKEAVTFAVEDINARGGLFGRQLEIVTYDVEDVMPEKVTASSEALSLGEKVDLNITSWIDYGVDVKAYGRYDVPYFSGAATTLSVQAYQENPTDYWNTLMYWPPEKEYARASWPQLMNNLPYEWPNTKLFIVNEDDQWSHFIADEFKLLAEKDGWEVVGAETVPTGTVEYGSTLTKIKSQDPALIVVISLSPAAEAAFMTQFLKNPTNSIVHMPYCPAAPEWLTLNGDNANGVVWSTTLAVLPGAEGEALKAKFVERFGQDTWNVSYSVAIWDMMHFWEEAVRAVGSVNDYKAIMDYINTHEYTGYAGIYSFPKETNTNRGGDDYIPAPFYQVQNGEHVQLFPDKWAQGEFVVPSWIKK